jgi:Amino acid transporters
MAAAIMISTFGCDNGLILAGARVYYAMARDGLFFRKLQPQIDFVFPRQHSGTGNLDGPPGFAAHGYNQCRDTAG